MKKIALSIITLTAIIGNLNAQSSIDKKAIDQLCGCFEVTFNYAETFTNDTSKQYVAKPLNNHAVVEYVFPVVKTDKKYVLQHVLVVGEEMIIKHWREDWEFEPSYIWNYNQDKSWVKQNLDKKEVAGKWLQTVWEVDDAPRYQGVANWFEHNGEYIWWNTADAPLPRREYTKRDDYNVMERTNLLKVSEKGWMHEQDNKKILRKAQQKDYILALEKGYNDYVRLPDAKCASASKFWTEDKAAFWKDVRDVWEGYLKSNKNIQLIDRVEDELLYEALDVVENKNLKGKERLQSIEKVMSKYIKS